MPREVLRSFFMRVELLRIRALEAARMLPVDR